MALEISRRTVLSAGAMTLATPTIIGVKALSEPSDFRVNHEPVIFPKLPRCLEGMGILHESDLHVDPGSPVYNHRGRISALTSDAIADAGLKPEEVCVVNSGDYYTKRESARAFEVFMKERRKQEEDYLARVGVLGNHDYERLKRIKQTGPNSRVEYHKTSVQERTAGILEASDYKILGSDVRIKPYRLPVGDGEVNVLGLPDFTTFRLDYDRRFARHYLDPEEYERYSTVQESLTQHLDPETLNLIIMHDLSGLEIDGWLRRIADHNKFPILVLSGHTHGGQTSLHWLQKKKGYKSDIIHGLHQLGEKTFVHVSAGLGTSENVWLGERVRFGQKPESSLLTFHGVS